MIRLYEFEGDAEAIQKLFTSFSNILSDGESHSVADLSRELGVAHGFGAGAETENIIMLARLYWRKARMVVETYGGVTEESCYNELGAVVSHLGFDRQIGLSVRKEEAVGGK